MRFFTAIVVAAVDAVLLGTPPELVSVAYALSLAVCFLTTSPSVSHGVAESVGSMPPEATTAATQPAAVLFDQNSLHSEPFLISLPFSSPRSASIKPTRFTPTVPSSSHDFSADVSPESIADVTAQLSHRFLR